MSLAAIIYISEFKENPQNAVKSVLENKDRFSEIHFVFPGYVEGNALYDGWEADKNTLNEHEITIFHDHFLNKETIDTEYIVEIPPYCFVKKAGIEKLQDAIRNCTEVETHFGLATGIKTQEGFSIWYGYLLVLSFFFAIWSHFERNKFFQSTDVRVTAIVRKGKHKYIPSLPSMYKYIKKDQVKPLIEPDDASVALLEPNISGRRYIWWTIRTNPYLNMFWLRCLPMIKPWMVFFLFYWIASFWSCVEFIKMCLYFARIRVIEGYNPWSVASAAFLTVWVFHWITVLVASTSRYKFKWQFYITFLTPLYTLTFPIVALYARLMNPKGGW